MFNKAIIGIVVFLLVLSSALCAFAFKLAERTDALSGELSASQDEIDALTERLAVSEKAQATQISTLSDELATLRGETLASRSETLTMIDTLDGELKGISTVFEQSVMNASKLYQEVSKGIVRISDGEKTVGSGFTFGPDGHIVTPAHVVKGQDQIDVILPDGRISAATVVGTCQHSDIAVLTLKETLTIEALTLADSATVTVGEPTMVIGDPFRLPGTVTSGIVSQTDRFIEVRHDSKRRWVANLIQFDAAVNFGNSGSPLLNSGGEVIGMVIARVDPKLGDGIYYAISSNKVKRVALSLIDRGYFDYPWLGLEIDDLTSEDVRDRNLETANGALVKKVLADGPAELAGVNVDDVIVAVDELAVREVADLTCYLGERKSPDEVGTLTVIRDGARLELYLKIGKR